IDPLGDARLKARHIPAHCSDVLDICTGLGYSALACIERGVQRVVTIERDPNVMSLARLNPWSRKLFDDDRVSIVVGDAVEEVARLEDERFCAVLHDPPRFGHAPSLYRIEFYSEIRRVLRPSGVLFHYVGSPGSRFRSTDVQKGVMNRLRSVGFVDIRRDVDTLGVVARKP
ncbi:MAG: methyltransferase domain-containing protein, partial [Candidatus Thorarchaeota archaeon]